MQPVYSDCDKEPKADELKKILDPPKARWLANSGADKKKQAEIYAQLRQYIDRKVLEGRIEELKKAAAHNNSEYTSDYLENRIKQLTDERGGVDE